VASIYSRAWSIVKYNPKTTVSTSLFLACVILSSIILWWVHVTVTPEDKRIIVLSSGIWKGLNGDTPIGGQSIPISKVGERLLWKKLQKKDKKKKISDTINKIIPHFIPVITLKVWRPWNVLSREISRHHCTDTADVNNKPLIIKTGS
jgi:mannose/fructose/N-acetylgalactosamine-specific phosphotransferase system component IID